MVAVCREEEGAEAEAEGKVTMLWEGNQRVVHREDEGVDEAAEMPPGAAAALKGDGRGGPGAR